MIYAVIDTNVFVSALFSKNINAATVKVLDAIFQGEIVPLYNDEIIAEYEDVLRRSKFHFTPSLVDKYLKSICKLGEYLQNVLRVMKCFLIKMMWCFMRLPFLKRMLTS